MTWQERSAWILMFAMAGASLAVVPAGLVLNQEQANFVRPILQVRDQLRYNYVEDLSDRKAAARLQEQSIVGMLSGLDDYTQYFPPTDAQRFMRMVTGNFQGIGVQLRVNEQGEIQVSTPMDNSPALESGIAPGDVILRANGVELKGKSFEHVRSHIAGEEGTKVVLDLRKYDGQLKTVEVERRRITSPTLFGLFRKPDGSQEFFLDHSSRLAYVRISQFTLETAGQLRQELESLLKQNMAGLILDLRSNPGGELQEALEMCNLFVEEGVILRTRGNNRSEQTYTVEPGRSLAFFPMVVLVNGQSASASEIVAGALAEHRRATIVGTRTFGKGSVQEPVELGDGAMLKMTVAHYYLPSGRLIHRKPDSTEWGVDPHIESTISQNVQQSIETGWATSQVFYTPDQAATRPATTRATDPQLQAATDALLAQIMLRRATP